MGAAASAMPMPMSSYTAARQQQQQQHQQQRQPAPAQQQPFPSQLLSLLANMDPSHLQHAMASLGGMNGLGQGVASVPMAGRAAYAPAAGAFPSTTSNGGANDFG